MNEPCGDRVRDRSRLSYVVTNGCRRTRSLTVKSPGDFIISLYQMIIVASIRVEYVPNTLLDYYDKFIMLEWLHYRWQLLTTTNLSTLAEVVKSAIWISLYRGKMAIMHSISVYTIYNYYYSIQSPVFMTYAYIHLSIIALFASFCTIKYNSYSYHIEQKVCVVICNELNWWYRVQDLHWT